MSSSEKLFKKTYFLCPDPYIWPSAQTVQSNLNRLGLNTGNLAFIQGVVNIFDRSTFSEDSFLGFFNRNKKYDIQTGSLVVIPLANHLDPHRNMELLGDFMISLREKEIKYIVLGLGSQFSSDEEIESAEQKLFKNSGFNKFLEGLASSSYITVRGDFTQSLLAKLGVKSESLSCPSIFIDIDTRDLGESIERKINTLKKLNKILNVSVNTLKDTKLKEGKRFSIENKIYSMPAINKIFIHQTSHGNEKIPNTGRIESDLILAGNDLCNSLMTSLSVTGQEMGSKSRIFFSTLDWRNSLEQFFIDINVGMRMHGNMIAIGSGVPGITIPIDIRMKEIVSKLKIPYIEPSDIENIDKLDTESFLNLVRFNGHAFDENRSFLASRYISILEEFEVPFNWRLLLIAN